MSIPSGMLALGLPSGFEWAIVAVVGLLLFGKRLPEVGRVVGRTIQDFRRGLSGMRSELEKDPGFRDAKRAVQDVRRAVQAPRDLANPVRMLDRMSDEATDVEATPTTPEDVYRQEHPESTHPQDATPSAATETENKDQTN